MDGVITGEPVEDFWLETKHPLNHPSHLSILKDGKWYMAFVFKGKTPIHREKSLSIISLRNSLERDDYVFSNADWEAALELGNVEKET